MSPADKIHVNRGALPRRYVLEVLYSTQKIVFPLWDPECVALLRALVADSGFDKEVLNGQNTSIVRDDEEKVEFEYLWPRLSELYLEIQEPRPRGWLATWLERRSGARYVLLATLLGVLLAVLLGIAGLAVSSYQTYLAFEGWQHPVSGDAEPV